MASLNLTNPIKVFPSTSEPIWYALIGEDPAQGLLAIASTPSEAIRKLLESIGDRIVFLTEYTYLVEGTVCQGELIVARDPSEAQAIAQSKNMRITGEVLSIPRMAIASL